MTAYPPPPWLTDLAGELPRMPGERFSRFLPPPEGGRRHSAVLVLFAPDPGAPEDPDAASVVITERAHDMRSHPGQPAFPGGGSEEGDGGPVDTALREAWEEVDLDRGEVDVLAQAPTLHIPVSQYDVTPVVAWWRQPAPGSLWAKDPTEVARVVQPSLGSLLDPAARFRVRHPSGYEGPAWDVDGLLVWGFTAGLLDSLLDLAGLTRPWRDGSPVRMIR